MTTPYLVHVDDVEPEDMQREQGWAISVFRLPVTGAQGSSTTMFHATFLPGSTHAKHTHNRCDEIAVYLRGDGVVGQGDQRSQVTAGHCRLIPAGAPHFFHNETRDREGMCIGFYMNATDVADTGYEFHGDVGTADLLMERAQTLTGGALVHVDDVPPLSLPGTDGWNVTDVRLPIGAHNGSPNAQFWMRLAPGDIHHKHRFERSEVVYFVASGHGVSGADGTPTRIRAGHVQYLPAGCEHFIANTGDTDDLEIIGVYAGAGGLEDTGYRYLGEVSAADLLAAT